MRNGMPALAIALALAGCAAPERGMDPGLAAEAGARIARGEAVVARWCADCHAIAVDTADAPSFRTIAQRPGRDEAYLAVFLREDHFPMTTFRLFDHERDDVAAFIVSLAPR